MSFLDRFDARRGVAKWAAKCFRRGLAMRPDASGHMLVEAALNGRYRSNPLDPKQAAIIEQGRSSANTVFDLAHLVAEAELLSHLTAADRATLKIKGENIADHTHRVIDNELENLGFERRAQRLWSEFDGLPNTKENLIQKAGGLASPLLYLVDQHTDELLETALSHGIAPEPARAQLLQYEVAILYLHFIERMACSFVPQNEGLLFSVALATEVFESYTRNIALGTAAARTRAMLKGILEEREREYYLLPILNRESESPTDCVVWKASEQLSMVLTDDNESVKDLIPKIQQTLLKRLIGAEGIVELPELLHGYGGQS